MKAPKTLTEAIKLFSDPDVCLQYFAAQRWPDGVVRCPHCGLDGVRFIAPRRLWECKGKHDRRQFSIKVGTIMEDSALGLDKWLCAMWLVGNCKNGVSSCELARDLGITQKSAWFMLHRIRFGMQAKSGGKLGGRIEVDETFIGGKARNMHASRRKAKGFSKTIVMGVLQRGGEIRAAVVSDREQKTLQPFVRENVQRLSRVFTDEAPSYNGLADDFMHNVINHAVQYVDGQIHTNGVENFWSLLKRGLGGTYISVEPFHLFRYVDEQAFRYNNRNDGQRKDSCGRPVKRTDSERLNILAGQIAGKRLTYAKLTGKEGETSF